MCGFADVDQSRLVRRIQYMSLYQSSRDSIADSVESKRNGIMVFI